MAALQWKAVRCRPANFISIIRRTYVDPSRRSSSFPTSSSSPSPFSSSSSVPCLVTQEMVDFSHAPKDWLAKHQDETKRAAELGIIIWRDFITSQEHDIAVTEFDPLLHRRKKYETGHWDGVIQGHREIQRTISYLSPTLQEVCKRVHALFPQLAPIVGAPMPYIHILDLLPEPEGRIDRHVDSIKFSGSVVSGLCLLSPAVMRLYPATDAEQNDSDGNGGYSKEEGKEKKTEFPLSGHKDNNNNNTSHIDNDDEKRGGYISLLLEPRCLYFLTGEARYKWAHAIESSSLGETQPVLFKGRAVKRGRRISVMFRDELTVG